MTARKRIGISTGGGDAPGLNAVIRAATLAAVERGWTVVGIERGFAGLLDPNDTVVLDRDAVRGITNRGGTILGTDNRGNPFEERVRDELGEERVIDRLEEAVKGFHRLGLDALIAIGGDGTMRLALKLTEKGVPVVGVPKTIDNDLAGTAVTFGFDTAVTVATEAIDRLHSTAESHQRVFVVEVMGRYAGWIALHSGIATGADIVLIPEIPFQWEPVFEKVRDREAMGRRFAIAVVAEGAALCGGEPTYLPQMSGERERLGGIAEIVAHAIAEETGKETRSLVLGHLQRGGEPTPRDRVLALRFGAAAVRTIEGGQFGTMVALDPPNVRTVPLEQAISRMKTVPLDGDTVLTARELGICLGE
ncbi:MAG TPA: ATP-dependent 6-phosphofructokinase [Thermoanaerobaculia bacterium]|nr:ATP-dependent 6-phosphofructokinase [Thermoanaerobaculia bacterium]